MPAFLTHWHVLIETARRSTDAGSDLGSLVIDKATLQRHSQNFPQTTPAGAVWDTGPLPKINYRFPGSDISAMAYLGALAPDITSYQKGHFTDKSSDASKHMRSTLQAPKDGSIPWHTLLHSNRSGDFLLALLENIAEIPAPALRSQALAFAMGYLSHIATDIALNPYINALAQTYATHSVPGKFIPLGRHFYVELCLDEYIAGTYFDRDLHTWTNQPWDEYIEPVVRDLNDPLASTPQTLALLVAAAETIYGLNAEQKQAFCTAYLTGLQRLRLYLAGRGSFRWFALNTRMQRRPGDPIVATIGAHQRQTGAITSEDAISYAIRLSEHLCRRAISYYASLRNTHATAEERRTRRTTLREDLRNWDLNTGYTQEVTFDQEITLRFLHNWIHFSDLWNPNSANNWLI